MLDKPISPLRQRMIDDMTARRFKEKGQKDYVRHVRNFAAFLRRSPDTATSEDVRLFQLHMAKLQIGAPTSNSAALRFSFNVTLIDVAGSVRRQEVGERAAFLTSVGSRRPCPG
jgi:integrase/recombinase XerD